MSELLITLATSSCVSFKSSNSFFDTPWACANFWNAAEPPVATVNKPLSVTFASSVLWEKSWNILLISPITSKPKSWNAAVTAKIIPRAACNLPNAKDKKFTALAATIDAPAKIFAEALALLRAALFWASKLFKNAILFALPSAFLFNSWRDLV